MNPRRPDPLAYFTGKLSNQDRPDGISLPGGGGKFYTDGSVQQWPGNTFICHIDKQSQAYEVIRSVQEEVKRSEFCSFFAFLPPPSFHMTIFEGISPGAEKYRNWPIDVSDDQSRDDLSRDGVTRLFGERIEDLVVPNVFSVQCTDIYTCHSLTMTGADDRAEKDLRFARESLRAVTGLHTENFEQYVFHITFAYLLEWVSLPLANEMIDFSATLSEKYCSMLGTVELGPVELCNFNTMHHFETVKLLKTDGGSIN